MAEDNNNDIRGGGSSGVSKEGQQTSCDLPSEQDRKAVMGCLAAVLNIIFAAHQRVEESKSVASAANGSSGSLTSQGNEETDDALSPDMANFSIRDEMDESSSTGGKSKLRQQRTTQRNKAFQRELLNISAELLFLPSDNAAVFLPNLDIQCNDQTTEQELLLDPFLESLSSSSESFRCIALLMFRFLLLSSEEKPKSSSNNRTDGKQHTVHDDANEATTTTNSQLEKMTIVGYDARVRYAFKHLTVSILSYWQIKEHSEFMTIQTANAYATRKFEALEEGIALRLSILSKQMKQDKEKLAGVKKQSSFAQSAVRGLKIGAAGVAAGTVFAITGGLAAPAIIGGIAAIAGASSAVTIVATVLLLPAATTIFGVGGGTLVAKKMGKRTAGLNEFDIVKVSNDADDVGGDKKKKPNDNINPELSRTVCIAGWLIDKHDFERPFGTTPRALTDPHEQFCRYCSVYQPDVIPHCSDILQEWQGKEGELWDMCNASYGKDPRSLLPLENGPRYDAMLIDGETKAVDDLIRLMGLPLPVEYTEQSSQKHEKQAINVPPTVNLLSEVLVSSDMDKSKKEISDAMLRSYKAWDFDAEYCSELYVVEWESELLIELYGSAKDFQKKVAKMAAEEIAKKTALATLMAAVFVPTVLVSLSNMIDEKWTLANERADEAGILLAQSLLNSTAGHRPVSLVGFSFGARMIIACLKELARNQEIWESQRERNEVDGTTETTAKAKVASFRKNLSKSMKQYEAQVSFNREPASIIEDVIMMGTVASVNKSAWQSCRGIVAGRLVNCYSTNDMILALMYRSKNLGSTLLNPPVGIRSVHAPGVENYDISHLVASHSEYSIAVHEILQIVGYNQPVNIR